MTIAPGSSSGTKCYTETEAVKMYQKSACEPFDGASKSVFYEEGHTPELVSGKGTILFSVRQMRFCLYIPLR